MQPMPGKTLNEEEERRLFYVAATRAKEKLIITYSGPTPQFVEEMKI
jgi:superfamily I DNA/RNA helicase